MDLRSWESVFEWSSGVVSVGGCDSADFSDNTGEIVKDFVFLSEQRNGKIVMAGLKSMEIPAAAFFLGVKLPAERTKRMTKPLIRVINDKKHFITTSQLYLYKS